nr:GNAT family N-acetyltransferase [Enterococcus sp. BWR-S5]
MEKLDYRYGEEQDTALILRYIKELAEYEGLPNEVKTDEATLKEWLFDKERAKVLFPLLDGKPIGFCVYFYNFSTFLGKSGLYIEDIYIEERYRGKGFGKQLIQKMFKLAKDEQLGRVEWACLNDNEPSFEFYVSQGAEPMSEWTVFRMADN